MTVLKKIRFTLGFISLLFLSACGTGFTDSIKTVLDGGSSVYLESVTLISDSEINDEYPVFVDIVFIKDRNALNDLKKKTANEYFQIKRSLQNRYLGKLRTYSIEIIGGITDVLEMDPGIGNVGALIFIRYKDKINKPIVVGKQNRLTIRLGKNNFFVKKETKK